MSPTIPEAAGQGCKAGGGGWLGRLALLDGVGRPCPHPHEEGVGCVHPLTEMSRLQLLVMPAQRTPLNTLAVLFTQRAAARKHPSYVVSVTFKLYLGGGGEKKKQ